MPRLIETASRVTAAGTPPKTIDEYTLVLRGELRVEHSGGELTVPAGSAVHTAPGEWVRYSSPGPEGAEYVAVCLPAFEIGAARRDPDRQT
ncbi:MULTISPECIES: cupin domain-containing protein [Pseudonocardia]|uniref:Cupin type-2 domain-containing protein n=1 Tax=Pseudonocardia saturnea TaxID=33909 RepID=A0ABQ0S1H7_9PSEU|nr:MULTISPECIES: cupin domain-containing protein [Pseudonocardia]BBG00175.1 hypothetical protein Pdca_13840 [Pseudonocardia autotrophica]GEC26756.1 hypothetical protein PSA01_37850 [Pseudonocardia saturnea]